MDTTTLFKVFRQESSEEILSQVSLLPETIIQEQDTNGQTLLHVAVFRNQLEVAAWLLNQGCDPNQKDVNQLSPFIAAAANGLDEMFHLLLHYSPDLTETNRFGGTALLPSSEKGYLRVVQQALDAGVPVNHINRLGWTALLEAAILGDDGFLFRDIIEALIQAGADVTINDFTNQTAIDYATQAKAESILEILKEEVQQTQFTEIKTLLRSQQSLLGIKKLLTFPSSLEKYYYLGYAYENLKRYAAAEYYYQQGLKEDAQFAYYLANLKKSLGEVEASLKYFEKGVSSSQRPEFFLYHQSNYLRELGRHEEAIAIMDLLLAKDKERVDYMFHKANSLRALGQQRAAHEVLLQADQLQPINTLFKEQAQQIMIEKTEVKENG